MPKSVAMMKAIVHFHDEAQRVVAESPADAKVTWAQINTTMRSVIVRVTEMKFLPPRMDAGDLAAHTEKLLLDMDAAFDTLRD